METILTLTIAVDEATKAKIGQWLTFDELGEACCSKLEEFICSGAGLPSSSEENDLPQDLAVTWHPL